MASTSTSSVLRAGDVGVGPGAEGVTEEEYKLWQVRLQFFFSHHCVIVFVPKLY